MKSKIIIYQVLPRLFGNKKETNKPNGTIEENGCGKFNDFTEKALSEIKKLGITHVWYTGVIEHATQTDYTKFGIDKDNCNVVKGKAGSPYAVKDYYDVDPDLAEDVNLRLDEFKQLVKRTHEAGLKVIIDFVGNHVARQYHSDMKPRNVKDLGQQDIKEVHFDPNNNFYYIPGQRFCPRIKLTDEANPYVEEPAKATGNDYFGADPSAYDWYETVKLNYGIDYSDYRSTHFSPTPDTWIKMKNILAYWTKMDIDGFRCDMAEMVPSDFWGWVIPQIKKIKKNVIFIAETYDTNQYEDYINHAKFDFLYDKVGLYDTLKDIICYGKHTGEIHNCWQRIDRIKDNMLNFLENHDEQRLASDFVAGDPIKGRAAMIVSASMSCGPVMIYSGQELGEKGMDNEGYSGTDGRTTIFDYWSVNTIRRWVNGGKFDQKKLTPAEKELRTFYTTLLNICAKERAIAEGLFFDLMYVNYHNPDFNAQRCYTFLRKHDSELLLVVANFDDAEQNLKINIPQHAFECLGIEIGKKVKTTELLTNEKGSQTLSPDKPFELTVKGQYGAIVKMNV